MGVSYRPEKLTAVNLFHDLVKVTQAVSHISTGRILILFYLILQWIKALTVSQRAPPWPYCAPLLIIPSPHQFCLDKTPVFLTMFTYKVQVFPTVFAAAVPSAWNSLLLNRPTVVSLLSPNSVRLVFVLLFTADPVGYFVGLVYLFVVQIKWGS